MKAIYFDDFDNSFIPQILEEIYIKKIYHPYLEGQRDLTIMDVGANIGLFTFYASKFAKMLYSIEPSPRHVEILGKMVETNGFKNVKILPLALSNKNGIEKLYHHTNTTMFSLREEYHDTKNFDEVVTVTLDKLFETEKIDYVDFLKLDVEGAENEVLTSEGFDKVKDNSTAYVNGWIEYLKDKPEQILKAAAKAEKAVNRIKGTEYVIQNDN